MKNTHVQKLVFVGLMVAIGIILGQVASISLPNASDPIIKFGIGYLPIILVSIIYGPVLGVMAGIAQDLLGFFLVGANLGQVFNLGFTLNAALYGLIPGLLFAKTFAKEKRIFFVLNFTLSFTLMFGAIWYFFHINQVISSSLADSEKYLLVGISMIGSLTIGVFNLIAFKSKKYGEEGTKLLFALSLLYILVSLILTPIWLTILNPGIAFWARIPLRIVKMPIEVFVYLVLLVTLLKLIRELLNQSKTEQT
ncbi:MAG: folate family ECF transporter S component [Bacilli bacterium]|nr:folate family ECF transporter S component [Bacilli bacterium]